MIESIEIHNSQSHANTKLEFSPGINVILGETDSGKSAIVRDFRLCLFNKPSAEHYRSYWGGDLMVKIKMNGHEITRLKSDKVNSYFLGETQFSAIKNDVPPEIKEVIRMEETNVQYQFSPLFLISKTPGEIAKYFNEIANITQLHTSQKKIQKKVDDLKREQERLKVAKADLKERLTYFDSLSFIEPLIDEMREVDKQIEIHSKKRSKINKLVEDFQEIGKEVKKIKVDLLTQLSEVLDDLEKATEERKKVKRKRDLFQDLVSSWKKQDSLILGYENNLKELRKKLPNKCPTCGTVLI